METTVLFSKREPITEGWEYLILAFLEASRAVLEASWQLLGSPWAISKPSWAVWGASRAVLETAWGHLGPLPFVVVFPSSFPCLLRPSPPNPLSAPKLPALSVWRRQLQDAGVLQ